MAKWRKALIEALRTSRERREAAIAEAAVARRQAALAEEVLGAWATRRIARTKDRILDFLRDPEERRRAADVRVILEGSQQQVDRRIEETLRKYDTVVESGGQVDLSRAAETIRAQMAWPAVGPVRGLPGATEELCNAVEAIEASRGEMPLKQAVKVLAALDPEGIEARYLEWRKNQGRPLT